MSVDDCVDSSTLQTLSACHQFNLYPDEYQTTNYVAVSTIVDLNEGFLVVSIASSPAEEISVQESPSGSLVHTLQRIPVIILVWYNEVNKA